MNKIYFVKDTSALKLQMQGHTLCLHHKDYKCPQLDANVMLFRDFKKRYRKEPALLNYDNIVFVGTNRIITPSNRNEPVFEVLFSGTRHIKKISIDHTPFINSDPWRIWFHFGITNTEYAHYDYSYAAESDYNFFLDGKSDYNPFALEEMVRWSKGIVFVDHDAFFDWDIVEVDVMPHVVSEYEKLKAELFKKETGPNPIVRKLARFAQDWCSQRHVPQPHVAFRQHAKVKIVKTNLKVDDYLTERLVSLMQLTNDYLWSMSS